MAYIRLADGRGLAFSVKDMKALFAITFFIMLNGALPALAGPAPVRILVSVGEIGQKVDLQWRRDACTMIHAIGNSNVTSGVQVTCHSFDAFHMIDTYLQQLKKDNVLHVRLLRGFRGSFRLNVINWNRTLDSDFINVGWSIGREPHMAAYGDDALRAIFENIFKYVQNENTLKAEWLLNARLSTKAIYYDFKELSFKSIKDRKKISVSAAASLFETESVENSAYLKARIEMAIAFTIQSPEGLNPMTPLDTLAATLSRAALQARRNQIAWKNIVLIDERTISEMTLDILARSAATDTAIAEQRLQLPNSTYSKSPGGLIYLF